MSFRYLSNVFSLIKKWKKHLAVFVWLFILFQAVTLSCGDRNDKQNTSSITIDSLQVNWPESWTPPFSIKPGEKKLMPPIDSIEYLTISSFLVELASHNSRFLKSRDSLQMIFNSYNTRLRNIGENEVYYIRPNCASDHDLTAKFICKPFLYMSGFLVLYKPSNRTATIILAECTAGKDGGITDTLFNRGFYRDAQNRIAIWELESHRDREDSKFNSDTTRTQFLDLSKSNKIRLISD